jgi:hypothetical protein
MELSAFHGPTTGEKPLFKASLNKKIRPVEHLGLESRRVLSRVARCQFGKNRSDTSISGWKFTSIITGTGGMIR